LIRKVLRLPADLQMLWVDTRTIIAEMAHDTPFDGDIVGSPPSNKLVDPQFMTSPLYLRRSSFAAEF
jgi:hypothetical protein